MYCPSCGKSNDINQKFCSGCGLSLRASAEVLARELADRSGEQLVATDARTDPEPIESRRGNAQHPLVFGFWVMMIGIFIAVLGFKVFSVKTVGDIGTLLALLGIGLVGFYGVISTLSQSKPKTARHPLPKAETTAQLQIVNPQTPPSITENTTRQLDAPPEVVSVHTPAQGARDTQPQSKEKLQS